MSGAEPLKVDLGDWWSVIKLFPKWADLSKLVPLHALGGLDPISGICPQNAEQLPFLALLCMHQTAILLLSTLLKVPYLIKVRMFRRHFLAERVAAGHT